MSSANQPRQQSLAALVQAAHQEMTPAQRHAGQRALRRRLVLREELARRSRLLLVGVSIAAVALVVGVWLGRSIAERPLSYSLRGGQIAEDGQIHVEASGSATLSFSEGSNVTLRAATHGRLVSVTHAGARLRIADGEADVNVVREPASNWEIDAGPYAIFARETAFAVRWSEDEQVLELGVHSGLVSVEGPLANDGVMLRGGQLLRIRRGEGEVVVREASPAELSGWFGANATSRPGAAASAGARPSPAGLSWSELLTEGKFQTIVDQAESAGLERILASADAADLAALADAARYTKSNDIAERALRAERERFAGSPGAQDAAFLLGQLYEADAKGSEAAEAWYERYLTEAPGGAYAAEALGRRMVLGERAGRHEQAAELASEYLERYPDGTHEETARALVARP